MNLERAILKYNKSIEYSGYYCTINKNHKKFKILWKSTTLYWWTKGRTDTKLRPVGATAASGRLYIMAPLSPQKTDSHFTKILPFITLTAWSIFCPQGQKKSYCHRCALESPSERHSISAELCQQANTNVKAHRFTANILCGKEWGGTWTIYAT